MFTNSGNPFTMNVVPSGSGCNGFGFGGDGGWLWVLIVFALIFGWGGNGFGGFGGNGGASVKDQYVLSSDFATIQRQLSDGFNSIDNALDRQNAGICDLGYTQQSLINGTNMNIMNGFNTTQAAIKDCCCQTQQNLADVKYTVATVGNGIQNQLQQCCCDVERQVERGFADTNYNMATQNCATLTAIDKVGDRIIDYLNTEKTQALRDENAALRLAASQSAQNNYLIGQLAPKFPIPSYTVPNPFANYGCGYGCGCNGTIA